jgi:hypothetical protein
VDIFYFQNQSAFPLYNNLCGIYKIHLLISPPQRFGTHILQCDNFSLKEKITDKSRIFFSATYVFGRILFARNGHNYQALPCPAHIIRSLIQCVLRNYPKLTVKILFPSFNQQVPLGELPVFGSSSDNESANCEVYLDWNNDNAFHQARAAGPGGYSDFSTWIYVYSEKNHLIVNGTNDLTAKKCFVV